MYSPWIANTLNRWNHMLTDHYQWQIQWGEGSWGLKPPLFFWMNNAFEWEHTVGTPTLLWVGTPFFLNGWIHPWLSISPTTFNLIVPNELLVLILFCTNILHYIHNVRPGLCNTSMKSLDTWICYYPGLQNVWYRTSLL